MPFVVLTRLARTAPRAVTDILKTLHLPDNPYVGDQVLQCMAKIRDPACIKQLGPLIAQLSENPARTSWLWIEELFKSWLDLGVFEEVFALTQGCLNRAIDSSVNQFASDSNVWLVKQVDEKFLANLALQRPFEVVTVLFYALCSWADQERRKHNESELSDDAPFAYWQEDFKTPPPAYRGVEATLAVRLFSAAEQIYRKGDPPAIDELDKLLSSHPWQLFRRLRWQLYADFPALSLHRARVEVLTRMPFLNEIDYSRGSHDYEFAQLLTSHVKQHGSAFLSPEEVAEFATTVLKGPTRKDGKPVEDYREVFCRKQLWPIASLLQGEQLVVYRAFAEDSNGMDIRSYKPFHSGGVVGREVVSAFPPEADKLGSMEAKTLWNFLNTWQPTINYAQPGRWVAEDIVALGTRFAELAEQRSDQFRPETKWWKNITGLRVLEWVNCGVFRSPKRAKRSRGAGFVLHSTRPPAVEGSLDLQCLEFAI